MTGALAAKRPFAGRLTTRSCGPRRAGGSQRMRTPPPEVREVPVQILDDVPTRNDARG